MANDLNQCMFTGRLGADPEIRSFQNGGRVCNLRLAVGQQWKDKTSGERREKTEWVSVTIHSEGLIGVAERFLKKGSKILVSGMQETRKWTDQQGSDRYSTECVLRGFDAKLIMLDGKPEGGPSGQGNQRQEQSGNSWGGQGGEANNSFGTDFVDDLDDDLPF